MKAALSAFVAFAAAAAAALAAEDDHSGRRASSPMKPSWEFAVTAYPTTVRGGENYTSAIGVADRGPLHLEARYNYESVGARSAFVGWTFSGGEELTWELTPLVGGAWGTTQAFVPGLEASVAWGRLTGPGRAGERAAPRSGLLLSRCSSSESTRSGAGPH